MIPSKYKQLVANFIASLERDNVPQSERPTELELYLRVLSRTHGDESLLEYGQEEIAEILKSPEFGAVIDRVLKWRGFDLGIEFLPKQIRFPGSRYARKLRNGYGHIRNYRGEDGDAADVYVNPVLLDGTPEDDERVIAAANSRLFSIDQLNPNDARDREYKFMVGYGSEIEAMKAYLQDMPLEWYNGVREVTLDDMERYRKPVKPSSADEDTEEGDAGKPAELAQYDAPGYRLGLPERNCGNCSHAHTPVKNGDRQWVYQCSAYQFETREDYLCEGWQMAEPDELTNDGDLVLTNPKSVILAVYPPDHVAQSVATPGGQQPEDLHVTIAYLGKVSGIPQFGNLIKDLRDACSAEPSMIMRIGGWGRFFANETSDWMDVLYGAIDCVHLWELRQTLLSVVEKYGLKTDGKFGFTPHMTLAYLVPQFNLILPNISTAFQVDTIYLCVGDRRYPISLGSMMAFGEGDERYAHIDTKPPESVRKKAKKITSMTDVKGVPMIYARMLASEQKISPVDMKAICKALDEDADFASMLGDEVIEWCSKTKKKMDTADAAFANEFIMPDELWKPGERKRPLTLSEVMDFAQWFSTEDPDSPAYDRMGGDAMNRWVTGISEALDGYAR